MAARLEAIQPVLMVRDVAAALAFYGRLGFKHIFSDSIDKPKYAGIRRDSVEMHVQWHDSSEWDSPNDRPTYRIVVSNVDQLFDEFNASNLNFDRTAIRDTAWGTREFHVRDPDGNGLQFYRNLSSS
jgi:catechol 2,3-dioxygenase-like lactoylglutathione lyase family enzyme